MERALEVEMTEHPGHDKSGTVTNDTANTRNGHSAKTLKGDFGALPLDIPRDRQGTFEPQLVGKHQTRRSGFDDRIISLYARVVPFFDYPPEIRKVIYTTNAIESINMSLRKVIKTRSSFPTDEAVSKLFYLALNNISKKWTMPIRDWKAALNRFAIQFEERVPQA